MYLSNEDIDKMVELMEKVAGQYTRAYSEEGKLLEELVNTPLLKIPFWIEGNRKKLAKLGIAIYEKPKEK